MIDLFDAAGVAIAAVGVVTGVATLLRNIAGEPSRRTQSPRPGNSAQRAVAATPQPK